MEVDAAQLLAAHGRNPFSGFVRYDAPWRWFEADAGAAPYLEHGRVALVWTDPLAGDPAAFLGDFTRELLAEFQKLSSEETQPESAGFFSRVREFLDGLGSRGSHLE